MAPLRLALATALLLALPACAPAPPAPAAWGARFPDADTVRVEALAPGVRHVYLWLPEGPWAVHLVEVDEAVCSPAWAALKAGPPLTARALTSELGAGALAALNADFFLIPEGTTVGAHVAGGRVVVGPGARPVYSVDGTGRHRAGVEVMDGFVAARGDTATLVQVNRPGEGDRHHPPGAGITLLDGWYGAAAPPDAAGATVRVRALPGRGPGASGPDTEAHRGVVASIHPPGADVPLASGATAFQGRGQAAAAWLARRSVGDTVAWEARLLPVGGGRPALETVGGFPLLVAGGRGVYAAQEGVIESFGEARHPRTAVGWSAAERRVLWLLVDGRRAPYSDGMSLPELEAFFLRLGVSDAINLDGGGSSALALRGRVVNRPSDAEGERPVGNALALTGCGGPPR